MSGPYQKTPITETVIPTKNGPSLQTEMEFIAGLVRVGTIPRNELENVLRMLYPHKSEEEFKQINDRIFDPKLEPVTQDQFRGSQLTDRIKLGQRFPPAHPHYSDAPHNSVWETHCLPADEGMNLFFINPF